jgi:hypothetical protein
LLTSPSTVFKTYARQTIIDYQAYLIANIIMSPNFPEYRHNRIIYHAGKMKTIIGTIMDPLADKNAAGRELDAIAVEALETSANMFQSRLTFQFVFNDTCSKFAAESHVALNSQLNSMMLQIKQWRLMLVVTPGITLRSDQGMSILPKKVTKSEVLVMN